VWKRTEMYGSVQKCMEKVFTVIVCISVMRLTLLTIVEEDCKFVEAGLNALLN
jgi:hypothetical protein